MPLPPYLISSASSHAHHALLVKLDAADSPRASDAAVQAEVARCRLVLEGKASSSKVAETLIILLTCSTVTTLPLDLEFALVPALQLAEGGKHMRHRRTGYRYLIEHLPSGHELGLLLINTVRKDLASSSPPHILMALHAICHLPGADLAPAVQPLLQEKRLLEHDLPAIRQRAIQALRSLGAALGLKDLARRIRRENDPSVLASVVRSFGDALDDGAREPLPDKRRRQFDTLFAAAARNLVASPLLLELIRALSAIVRTLPTDPSGPEHAHVLEQARSLADEISVEAATSTSPWTQACLLQVTGLVAALYAADGQPCEALTEHLRRLLLPREKGKGRATSHSSVNSSSRKSEVHSSPRKNRGRDGERERAKEREAIHPNTRVLILKCLQALPPALWMDGLTEAHMGALMAGVDSGDSTTRRETLRLLAKVDASLPRLTLQSHLQTLESLHETDTKPLEEAGARALEALEISCEGSDPTSRGTALAEGVASIAAHLPGVWLGGVHASISYLSSPHLRAPFIDGIASMLSNKPNPTLAVILATLATEYDRPGGETVPALLGALPTVEPSVQELIVLALVPLEGGAEAVRTLRKVAEGAIPHIARRCEQVATVLEKGRAWDVVGRSKSRALNDILDALLAVYAEIAPKAEEERDETPTASVLKNKPSQLKYNYDGPGSTLNRAAELSMGRSMLVERGDEVALDNLAADTGRVRLT